MGLENNARMLTKKQTKSTLSLDKEELTRYVSTDQTPFSGAINHQDLGAHIDHAKLQARGMEYHRKSTIYPVKNRFANTMGAKFNCDVGYRELLDSPRSASIKCCSGRRYVVGKYEKWHEFEFREDEPVRKTVHGPKHFNAENLGERPLPLNSCISQNNHRAVERPSPGINLHQSDKIRNATLRNRAFLDLARNKEKFKPCDLSKCNLLVDKWIDKSKFSYWSELFPAAN